MKDNRLFVGNLAYNTIENDLSDLFGQAGSVISVNLMMDKFTGKSRGFAFVEFASPEEATKAVEMFNGKDFQGRALTVNIARPREERPQRSNFRAGDRGDRGGDKGDRGDRGERRGGYRDR
jgi:cold-inducible RNA-binding protein